MSIEPSKRQRLFELAALFLRLGTTAFGGPAAHIALMEQEVVGRLGWLTHEEFLDLLGAANLIPGPNSTEMALHIGHRRAGWAGLLVAGTCFIVPAMLIVLALAALYRRASALPQLVGAMYGIKPVMVAVILQALWGLSKTAVKRPFLGVIALASVAASFGEVNELVVLLAAGVVAMLERRALGVDSLLWLGSIPGEALAAAPAVSLAGIFGFFLKVGSVLYGSGYVLLAFIRSDLVEHLHWLTEGQLLDAIAVGQFTPGPVFTTATFIGYLLAGLPGGLVATLGIFLPAFVFVAISGPLVPRLRASRAAGAFLDGVNVASLGLMGEVTWYLGRTAIVDVPTGVLGAGAAALLLGAKLNSTWLILGGAVIGILSHGG